MKNYKTKQEIQNKLKRGSSDWLYKYLWASGDLRLSEELRDDNGTKYLKLEIFCESIDIDTIGCLKSCLSKCNKCVIGRKKILIPKEKNIKYLIINGNVYRITVIPQTTKRVVKKTSPRLLQKVELENTNGSSFKTWVGELYSNSTVVTRWGRIGESLTSKTFPRAGISFLRKKEREKINKGYEYI